MSKIKNISTTQLLEETNISFKKWTALTRKERQDLDNKKAELEKEWELWLFKDEGVEENPKRKLCFSMAWEQGHSAGYEEVEGIFRDLEN